MDPRIDPGLACSSYQFRCQLRPHKVDLNFVSTLLPRYILPLSFECGTSLNLHYRLRLQRLLLSLQLHQSLVKPLHKSQCQSQEHRHGFPDLEPLVALAQNGSIATSLQSRTLHKPTVRSSPSTGRPSLIFARWCYAIFTSARDHLRSRSGRLV